MLYGFPDQCAVIADGAGITERLGKSKKCEVVEFSCIERLESGNTTPAKWAAGCAAESQFRMKGVDAINAGVGSTA